MQWEVDKTTKEYNKLNDQDIDIILGDFAILNIVKLHLRNNSEDIFDVN